MVKKRIVYGINERGLRVGEGHPNAKLTDEEVDRIRDIYEEGFVGYATLAEYFHTTKESIAKICQYQRRATTPTSWRSEVIDVVQEITLTTQMRVRRVQDEEDLV